MFMCWSGPPVSLLTLIVHHIASQTVPCRNQRVVTPSVCHELCHIYSVNPVEILNMSRFLDACAFCTVLVKLQMLQRDTCHMDKTRCYGS